jgi:hypothetical protein
MRLRPSLGALAAYSPARADDTAAEIRALKAGLKLLEQKVSRHEQQVRGIAKFPKMPPVAETPIVCKDAPCPPPPPPVFVSFANGLKVESWDGAFSFKIGGRIFVDGGVNSQPIQTFPPPGTTLPLALRPFSSAWRDGFSTKWVSVRPASRSKAGHGRMVLQAV